MLRWVGVRASWCESEIEMEQTTGTNVTLSFLRLVLSTEQTVVLSDPKRSSSNSPPVSCEERPSTKQSGEKKPQLKRSKLNDGSASKESTSGPSVSFPIKRSTLSTKHLDTPVTFRSTDTEHESEDSHPESKPVITIACSHQAEHIRKSGTRSASPSKKAITGYTKTGRSCFKQSPFSAKPPNVRESQSSSVETSQPLSAHEGEFAHGLESSLFGGVTKRDSEASIPHKSSEKLRLKSQCHHGSSQSDSSRGRQAGCSINHESNDSTALVTYNNTDDEQAQTDTLALPSHSNKKCRHAKRLKDVNELNLNVTPDVPSQIATSTDDVLKVSKSRLSNEIKMVKTTAKSSWDSSDSDFEASTVDRTQVNVLSEKSLGIDESQSTKQYVNKEVDAVKRSSARRKSGSVASSDKKVLLVVSIPIMEKWIRNEPAEQLRKEPIRKKLNRPVLLGTIQNTPQPAADPPVDMVIIVTTVLVGRDPNLTRLILLLGSHPIFHVVIVIGPNPVQEVIDIGGDASVLPIVIGTDVVVIPVVHDLGPVGEPQTLAPALHIVHLTLQLHSDELHQKVSSNSKLMRVDQPASPPEIRLARLGVGPVRQNGVSDNRTNNLKTAFSLSNVAETVSAAVKRVTGGNAASTKYTLSSENGTSETHSRTTSRPSDKVDAPVPASGLVDIPLPKDATQSSLYNRGLEELPIRNEPVPYIGPQVSKV
ncbi:hypothetical protein AHF37_04335 [Paragonimus kellicotti]|nr:hypothetical protein AHF37_04335 [Paragonimus kellicotti]